MNTRTNIIWNSARVMFAVFAIAVLFVGQVPAASALTVSLPGVISVSVGGSSGLNVGIGLGGGSSDASGSSSSGTNNLLGLSLLGGASSNPGTVGIGSIVDTLPLVSLGSDSTGGAASAPTSTAPLLSLSIAPYISMQNPGGLPAVFSGTTSPLWKSDSPLVAIVPSTDTGTEGSDLLSIQAGLAGSSIVSTGFGTPHDWSNFNTLGIWVLPDSDMDAGLASIELTGYPSGGTLTPLFFALPKLTHGVWQYVRIDLSQCPAGFLASITGYGFRVTGAVAHTLHFYPFQLGPGALDHFRLIRGVDKTVTPVAQTVQIEAMDAFDNVLSSGAQAYNGVKPIVFCTTTCPTKGSGTSAGITPSLGVSATVGGIPFGQSTSVQFNEGVSEPLQVSASLANSGNSVNVTDGTVSSLVGDLTYGLTPSPTTGTLITDPSKSVITVTPNPALVGSPELVTVTTYTAAGNPMTIGGDTVSAIISGANSMTLPLTDLGDGIYQGIYTPTTAGIDMVNSMVNGNAVNNNYSLPVAAGVAVMTGGGGSLPADYSNEAGSLTGTSADAGSKKSASSGSASTACTPYMTKYIQFGAANDPAEVTKLQDFLRTFSFGSAVTDTGVYDPATFAAVVQFQETYLRSVLSPWKLAVPTGYVYILTLREINLLECARATNVSPSIAVITSAQKAPYCPYFTATATQGTTGPEVVKAQQFLVDFGYLPTNLVLGTYGSMTANAIKQFQTDHKSTILDPIQSPATGRWGVRTMAAANQMLGCPAN